MCHINKNVDACTGEKAGHPLLAAINIFSKSMNAFRLQTQDKHRLSHIVIMRNAGYRANAAACISSKVMV